MRSVVLSEIKRMVRRGDALQFVKHAPGVIGLRKWMGRGLAFQIERHNAEIRRKLLDGLKAIDPADFETLVGRLLVALGFEDVVVTRVSADGGIDVRGVLVLGDAIETRMAAQVKRWKANVQRPTVQQVRGSLGAHDQGLIITTGGFRDGATEKADAPNKNPGRAHGRPSARQAAGRERHRCLAQPIRDPRPRQPRPLPRRRLTWAVRDSKPVDGVRRGAGLSSQKSDRRGFGGA